MSKLTVVMYHYVRDLKNTRFPDIKGLDLHLFVEQILFLKKNYDFVTAEEVIHSLDHGDALPEKSVLLTFDDAYIDHYTNVFPILNKYGIQGSFYIPTKAVSENTILDVNKIHFILASEKDKLKLVSSIKELLEAYQADYNVESFDVLYERYAKPSRYDTKEVMFIKSLLQYGLPEALRNAIIGELFLRWVGMEEAAFSRELYMSTEQVMTMHRCGMHIGTHGYNHYWWDKLTKDEMNQELDISLKYLFEIGISPVTLTACYPYGSYNEQAIDLLKQKGCRYAVTTDVGIAQVDSESRFVLPRLDTNDLPKSGNAEVNDWYSKC